MGLVFTHVGGPKQDLAGQVGGIHPIEVVDDQVTHAGIRQVQARHRAEAPQPYHQHAGGFQPLLPARAELRECQVPAVADRIDFRHGGAPCWPSDTRGRPARSLAVATLPKPAAFSSTRTSSPCRKPCSSTSQPPGCR